MVSFEQLDFWLAKGFSGIVNILHTRVTQFAVGFDRRAQQLLAIEACRIDELVDAVQANPRTGTPEELKNDLVCIDRWFVRAFTGLDSYLTTRCSEGPERVAWGNLQLMESHANRILALVREERGKYPKGEEE